MDHCIGPVTADLKNWRFTAWMGHRIVLGRIYGDTKGRWEDNTPIHTSSVKKVEKRDNCSIVITRNSVYRLWDCDEAVDGEAEGSSR